MRNDFSWRVDILDQLADLQSAYQNLRESPLTNQPIERTSSRLLIRRGGAVNARRADDHLHSEPGGKPRWASQILMDSAGRRKCCWSLGQTVLLMKVESRNLLKAPPVFHLCLLQLVLAVRRVRLLLHL